MSDRTLTRSIVGKSALTICAMLALSPVFAADFPVGSYGAKGLLLIFDEKGRFLVNQGETTEVSGTYSIQEGRIELTDVKGPWACTSPGKQTGTYNWKLDSAALSFSKVADGCDDRSGTLVAAAWKRVR